MQSRSNVTQRILEWKYPSLWDILFQCFWTSNIFKKYYHCQANIPFLSPWYIPPSTSVQTCKPMCNVQPLDLQILSHLSKKKKKKKIRGVSFISGKSPGENLELIWEVSIPISGTPNLDAQIQERQKERLMLSIEIKRNYIKNYHSTLLFLCLPKYLEIKK